MTIPVVRKVVPPPAEPKLEIDSPWSRYFADLSWVWYPEGDPAQAAPPGSRYFRKQVTLPEDREITRAVFAGTADNHFSLLVNGKAAGRGDDGREGWRNPVELDVRTHLQPGLNLLAIAARNASDQPNPAGLLGVLRVEFDRGNPLIAGVDASWKTAREEQSGWTEAGFDDSAWLSARIIAPFGGDPWGRIGGGRLTLSPVKADPFFGRCELPADLNLKQARVFLELEGLEPEAAARVTVNEVYAGGLISGPLRLEVTDHLRPGQNSIRIEPFAPKVARLVAYKSLR